ncbi:MAG TPA: hypothetical protein DEB05_11820 [Firmicutes bacterium]|nr:hypothetical protein [Bacillota bacterium]
MNKKRKISPVCFILIGLAFSALAGMIEWQLFLDKPIKYREMMLWKYTVILYVFIMFYSFYYFLEEYLPVLLNLIKWVGLNFFLSIPYYIIIVLTGTVLMNDVLSILPAQMLFLATIFIYHVATEFDPQLYNKTTKIMIKGIFLIFIVFFIAGFLRIPKAISLTLGTLTILGYNLLLLRRAKKKMDSK